jgi:hypothetical protein
MNDSPVFVVGCPRSGTGLLRDLLRSHPHLAFPEESHFIPAFYKAYGDPQDEREARQLAARILNLHWVRAWGLSLRPDSLDHLRSFRDIVSRIYEQWARKEGKSRWGDKTPHYVTEISTLLEVFPSCKIIHLYRDGRDVALSWLHAGFEPQNLFTAAHAWKNYVEAGRRAGAALPPELYLEVRYESLLSAPVDTLKWICAFLDEPFSEAVLSPTCSVVQTYRPRIVGDRKGLRVSGTDIVSTNAAKWKRRMPPSDRVLFESVAGDLLRSLRYETEGRTRRIAKTERLLWHVHHQFWWLMERVNTKNSYELLMSFLQLRSARMRHRLKPWWNRIRLSGFTLPG